MGRQGHFWSRQILMGTLFLLVMMGRFSWVLAAGMVVEPNEVKITQWVEPTRIHVRAHIPDNTEAVLVLLKTPGEVTLLKKVRHWGMWKSGPEIHIRGVPRLYFAMSTLPELLTRSRALTPWPYGIPMKRVSVEGVPSISSASELLQEFVKLEMHAGRYAMFPGGAKIVASAAGGRVLEGAFTLPANATPGDYRVILSIIQNGRVVARKTQTLKVALAGCPAFISTLARTHGLAYGILAVGVAVTAGLLVGFGFQFVGRRG